VEIIFSVVDSQISVVAAAAGLRKKIQGPTLVPLQAPYFRGIKFLVKRKNFAQSPLLEISQTISQKGAA